MFCTDFKQARSSSRSRKSTSDDLGPEEKPRAYGGVVIDAERTRSAEDGQKAISMVMFGLFQKGDPTPEKRPNKRLFVR